LSLNIISAKKTIREHLKFDKVSAKGIRAQLGLPTVPYFPESPVF